MKKSSGGLLKSAIAILLLIFIMLNVPIAGAENMSSISSNWGLININIVNGKVYALSVAEGLLWNHYTFYSFENGVPNKALSFKGHFWQLFDVYKESIVVYKTDQSFLSLLLSARSVNSWTDYIMETPLSSDSFRRRKEIEGKPIRYARFGIVACQKSAESEGSGTEEITEIYLAADLDSQFLSTGMQFDDSSFMRVYDTCISYEPYSTGDTVVFDPIRSKQYVLPDHTGRIDGIIILAPMIYYSTAEGIYAYNTGTGMCESLYLFSNQGGLHHFHCENGFLYFVDGESVKLLALDVQTGEISETAASIIDSYGKFIVFENMVYSISIDYKNHGVVRCRVDHIERGLLYEGVLK